MKVWMLLVPVAIGLLLAGFLTGRCACGGSGDTGIVGRLVNQQWLTNKVLRVLNMAGPSKQPEIVQPTIKPGWGERTKPVSEPGTQTIYVVDSVTADSFAAKWKIIDLFNRRNQWILRMVKADSVMWDTLSTWRNTVTLHTDRAGVNQTERWNPVDIGWYGWLGADIDLPRAEAVRWRAEVGLQVKWQWMVWSLGVGTDLGLNPYVRAGVRAEGWW